MNERESSRSVGWLVCLYDVDFLLEYRWAAVNGVIKNRAKVKQVTEFRCVRYLQKLIIYPAFISGALSRYSVHEFSDMFEYQK